MQKSRITEIAIEALTVAFCLVLAGWGGLALAQDKNEELINAAARMDLNDVETFIRDGADVNARDKRGRTALMQASTRGSLEVAALLLKSGADVNAKDSNGGTALLAASGRGGLEVVKLLLENGADVKARDNKKPKRIDDACMGR